MRVPLFIIFLLTVNVSCTSKEPHLEREVVVNALVFSNRPINNIEVGTIARVGLENEPIPPDEIQFLFGWRNQVFQLFESVDEEGIYFDPSEEIIPEPGDTLAMQITFEDQVIESFTIVPSFPEDLEIPFQSFEIDPNEPDSDDFFPVLWSNPEGSFYTGIIELLSDTSSPVINDMDNNGQTEINLPITDESSYFIEPSEFDFFGSYRIILFHVNSEYASFFLAEPGESQFQVNSNVSNAFGIFTALNSDTAFFEIIPEQ